MDILSISSSNQISFGAQGITFTSGSTVSHSIFSDFSGSLFVSMTSSVRDDSNAVTVATFGYENDISKDIQIKYNSASIGESNDRISFYISSSGRIGFGTNDPNDEFDVKADSFKIRSKDGSKETEFVDGRLIAKKFGNKSTTETTGSQLVLTYTPGTFSSPSTASAGDILGTVTWEDLSIGNRDDATAMQIQGRVEAVAADGSAIKGTMRFGIGASTAGDPIYENLVLSLGAATLPSASLDFGGNDSTADRKINFRSSDSNERFIMGVDASRNSFVIHSTNLFPGSGEDFRIASTGDVSLGQDLTVAGVITSQGDSVVSQSGAFVNNEFIVAVGTNAVTSSDALAVDSNGNLGIGTASPSVRLHMLGEAAQTSQILMEQYNDTSDAPDIRTRRYRGTVASPQDVQTGDYLFRLNVHGQDGGSSELYGSMQFDVDSSDQDALNWRIQTRDTSGTVADRITIDANGDISASGNIIINELTSSQITTDVRHLPNTTNSDQYYGDVVKFGGGGTLTQGSIYYLDSSRNWALADASAASTAQGMLGIATSTGIELLVRGLARHGGWAGFTTGAPIYLSETAGELTTTAPTTSGAVVRVVGYSTNGSVREIYFNPDSSWIELS